MRNLPFAHEGETSTTSMERIVKRSLLALSLALSGTLALLPEPAAAASDDGVVERVVVRNRKHSLWNKVEVSPMVGLSITNRMTEQYNFQLGLAYNFSEHFAIEARPGYALGGPSSIAKEAQQGIIDGPIDHFNRSEFEDLWRLEWSALLLPRWTPIYGKINLATELPIHFQAYLTAGAGMVGLTYDAVVYMQAGQNFLSEQRQSFAIAGGAGMRFFVTEAVSLRLELFDIAYPDEYRADINRENAAREVGDPQEGVVTSAGLTNVLFFNAGISATF